MQNHILYGQKRIDFTLRLNERKTIEIAVHPDCLVTVKAPPHADLSAVEIKVKKRARWILKQLNYFQQFQPQTPKRYYVSGESHLYLGRKYRLKCVLAERNQVKLLKGHFLIESKRPDDPKLSKKLLDQWYRDKAKIHLQERFEAGWENYRGGYEKKPVLVIKAMQTRWGSLSEKGTLTLNTSLIRASKECVDYVVMHELCHLKIANHSPQFYELLETMMPQWQERKHKLELSLA